MIRLRAARRINAAGLMIGNAYQPRVRGVAGFAIAVAETAVIASVQLFGFAGPAVPQLGDFGGCHGRKPPDHPVNKTRARTMPRATARAKSDRFFMVRGGGGGGG